MRQPIPLEPQALSPIYEKLVATLDQCISTVTAANLVDTALMLRIVKLDLLMRINGISDDELEQALSVLRALCNAAD